MKESKIKLKKHATVLSIISNSFLIVLKFIAGFLSGSMSIISEAIHSSTDLLASFIAYVAVIQSSKPADEDHQFGHGKYEYIASLFESILIIFAGVFIAKEAFEKLSSQNITTIDPNLGLIVMGISIVTNFIVSKYLLKIAKLTNSPAIMADGSHLSADMFSSVAVIMGLLMVKLTGHPIFDILIALIVTVMIILTGIKLFKEAQENLLDKALTKTQIDEICNILKNYSNYVTMKNLKTRQNGFKKNIEITLLVDGNMTVCDAHKLCDEIETAIDKILKDTEISIHLEPQNITRVELAKNV